MKALKFILITTCLWLALACPTQADLTAIVTAGYQFPLNGTVAPSYDLLNRLALPTIKIVGTVGGSNTLAPGSITGNELNNNVADGFTIGFNGSSPPALQVLSAGIVGPGLQSLTTTNLGLLVDTNYFDVSSTNSAADTNSHSPSLTPWLTLRPKSLTSTNFADGSTFTPGNLAMTSGTLLSGGLQQFDTNDVTTNASVATWLGAGLAIQMVTNIYTTTNVASITTHTNIAPGLVLKAFSALATNSLANQTMLTAAHGFHRMPTGIRGVLLCTSTDAGFATGDELDISNIKVNDPAGQHVAFALSANATNVTLQSSTKGFGFMTLNPSSAVETTLITSKWKLKIYANE